jgi:hypothetical protein
MSRGSNQQLNSVGSRNQGRKVRDKDRRIEEQRRNPIVVAGKDRTKMRNEAGGAIINPVASINL